MPSFEEILNQKSSEVKSPQAYPVGTYHCLLDGPLEPGKSSQKGTDFLRAKFKILAPYKDVDQAMAAEQQVAGKIITNDYYVTDGATWRLKELLVESLGIESFEGTPKEKSIKEMISEAPGRQLLVTLRHEASPDGKRVFHRVASTAHV